MNELEKFEQSNKEILFKFLEQHNPGHDDLQMEHFIVGGGITDYGKFKQAVAETFTNYEALKANYAKLKITLAEIEVLVAEKAEMEKQADPVSKAKVRLLEAQIEEKQLAIGTTEKQIKRNVNELGKMFEMAKFYEKKIEGQDREQLIKDYHFQRLSKLMALNTIYGGPNLNGVMDMVMTLPDDMQKSLVGELNNLLLIQHKNYLKISSDAQASLEAPKNN